MKLLCDFSSADSRYRLDSHMRALIRRAIKLVLESEDYGADCGVSVSLVEPDEIRRLNKVFRKKDAPTDVLSFPMEDDDYGDGETPLLGDIILCPEIIEAQSKDFGNDFVHELIYMTIHSTFHLLGYDHVDSEEEKREMFGKQDAVFELFCRQEKDKK